MIRLIKSLKSNDIEPSEDIMRFLITTRDSYLIRFDNDIVGATAFSGGTEIVYLNIYFLESINFEKMNRTLNYVTEAIIKKFHPHKIFIIDSDMKFFNVYNSCGYYSIGKNFQKVIEPLRYEMKDNAFDDEGFIINQGLLENIPFGFFNTKDKGCGWIATYNLFKILGFDQSMQKTKEELENMSPFGELMGQPILSLYIYLKANGLNIRWYVNNDKNISKRMLKSKCGILAYSHKNGAHYTTYQTINNKVHFYNAIYGNKSHIIDPYEFLNTHSLLKYSILLYIE